MSTALVEHPNDVAVEITGRDYISYSALSTYQRCPAKYSFRYVQGLPEETVASSLIFGGAIHSAVELHFNEVMVGNPAPDLDILLDTYQEAWRDRDLGAVQFGKGEDVNTLSQLAERMLMAFQAYDSSNPIGTILGVEEELRGELSPECPDLLAKVDLIVEEDDAVVVTDLKTARSRWSQGQVSESAEQLLLYSELAKHLLPDKEVRLQFIVITKTKAPAVTRHEVTFDTARLERTKRIVERVWEGIQSGIFYPAPSPMNCSTCSYREACRQWGG